jgi:hypothetical protein
VIEKNSTNVKRMHVSLEVERTRCSKRDKSMYFHAVRIQCGVGLVRVIKRRYNLH